MKKKLMLIGAALLLALLAACGSGNEEKSSGGSSDKQPEKLVPIEVKLSVPEHGEVNKPVKLKVAVTQGDEKVADADEVEYEIWKNGKKEGSELLKSNNNKDGTYTAEKTFAEDGVYTVQVHVTARDQHQMPKAEIAIGDAKAEDAAHEDQEGEHGHHHAEDFSMHVKQPDAVKKGEEAKFAVHLELKDKPLEKADVRFEISKGDDPKHEWVSTKETAAGVYEGAFAFKEAGTYKMIVHVENKDGLHEHEEHEINVK